MKAKIVTFIHHLLIYDYILFGAVFALFVLLLILAIVLRERLGIALFFVLLSFTLLLLGPTLGYIEMHKYLFKNETKLLSQQKLHFVDAIVVHGALTNESKFDFKECVVQASAYRVTKNKIKNYIFRLKPLRTNRIILKDIAKGVTRDFKLFIEPFRYSKEYSVALQGSCR